MRFVKMHGSGNDYVYVDCFSEPEPPNPAELASRVSDRHFGIGSDGLILICPSSIADARMRIFNADGSEAEMCGNGIRCVAKYLYDRGIVRKEEMTIETGRGVLQVRVYPVGGRVQQARVDMGVPVLDPTQIPTTLPGHPPLEVPLRVEGHLFHVGAVSLGNPHCVVFVEEEVDTFPVGHYGPLLERCEAFPRRANVEFAQVIRPDYLKVRVWERGSGETLACGTGACAAVVVAALSHRLSRQATVRLRGGELHVDWAPDHHIYLTGPAEEVFQGEWPEETEQRHDPSDAAAQQVEGPKGSAPRAQLL
jgi:diaminopimelate epimerase